MHVPLRSRLTISLAFLCVGAHACTDRNSSSAESATVGVQVVLADPEATVPAVSPCEHPLPVGGNRMKVDPDFPADVLLIFQPGSDGKASPEIVDLIEQKHDIKLTPFLSSYGDLIGGSAPLSNAQLATIRCEPGVLAIRYEYSDESLRFIH